MPYPPFRGDKLKIYNLARRLSKKHELHLLTFTESEDDYRYLSEVEKIFTKVKLVRLPKLLSYKNVLTGIFSKLPFQVLYFQKKEMQQAVDNWVSGTGYDAVHVQHLRMAPYLENNQNIPRILDLPDAFSLYWKRRKSIERGIFTMAFESLESKRVLVYEAVIKKYNLALACSQEDVKYLQETHKTENVKLLPNGVDLDTFKSKNPHDYSHNKTLLFTGNMDYAPNVDAVIFFCQEIFPEILKQFPDVKFVIAGQRPVDKVKTLAGPNVLVTGFIEHLAETYNEASVVVAPLRFGAGTQNKVLEAMAMGVPVVCSHIGFAGLGIENGEGAFMSPEAQGFTEAVISLLQDENLRRKTGEKGKEIIYKNFSWDSITLLLEKYLMEISAVRN